MMVRRKQIFHLPLLILLLCAVVLLHGRPACGQTNQSGTASQGQTGGATGSVTGGAQGIVVTDVDPVGPAANAGVQAGDLIVEANRQPVLSVADLEASVQRAGSRPLLLLINRRGASLF